MVQQTEYESPYCPICEACGEGGCCSPLHCEQNPGGHYCPGYLNDLKFGYIMNSYFQEKIWGRMSDDLKKEYDEMWDRTYNEIYNK
jgi:hypothetical protein